MRILICLAIYVVVCIFVCLFLRACAENNEIYDSCYDNDPLCVGKEDCENTDEEHGYSYNNGNADITDKVNEDDV